jgi:hypothetical protein
MSESRYWLIPPGVYDPLNCEFGFDFDPCPCPLPEGFDGTKVDWGRSNWVNPPFHRENGVGPTAFVRKAITEQAKGKSSFLVIPTQSYVNLLLEAGAELRSMGRIRWLEVDTKEPTKGPSPITGFWLPGTPQARS